MWATFSPHPWWGQQMKIFFALLAICAGNSPVLGEFPAQRPVTRSFDVFFDRRLNKWLRKQSWGWWFETLSRPLWRHCNVLKVAFHNAMNSYFMSTVASLFCIYWRGTRLAIMTSEVDTKLQFTTSCHSELHYTFQDIWMNILKYFLIIEKYSCVSQHAGNFGFEFSFELNTLWCQIGN